MISVPLNIAISVTASVQFDTPISAHPDLDLIEDNEAKRTLLSSTMFWGTAGAVFGIHDEPDKFGSVNYLHPIDGTHAKYWIGFTITDLFWKVIEQILDDVVAKGEGEEPADLVFDDDEEFRKKDTTHQEQIILIVM